MPDETVNNFKGLSCSRPALVRCEPNVSLSNRWMVASISFSPRSFITNFSVFHSVECHTSQDELTKSTLLNLFSRKGEGGEQFYYYLHQNGFQGLRKRDLGINTESAEELVEGREQIYEGVVARTSVFGRLQGRRMPRDMQMGWRMIKTYGE